MRRSLRRLGALLALLAGLALVTVGSAGPASAHTVGGSGTSDYLTRLLSFDGPPGVTLRVVENGNKLILTNHTATPVTILGYQNEPYLRVTAAGVQANQRSQATFDNVDRYLRNVVIPPSADNKGIDFTSISGKPVAVWHDHRIHWMASSLPPSVAAHPASYHVIQTWKVNFLYGSTPFAASGELDWVPGPSPLGPVLISIAALIVAGVLGLRSRRLLGVGLLALTAADVVHTVGVAADRANTTVAAGFGAYPAVDVIWVGAVVGAVLLLAGRRTLPALVLSTGTAAWMLLIGGLADIATFKDTTSPFYWHISLERVLTAIELGAGLAVVVLSVRALLGAAGARPRRAASYDDDDYWDDDLGTYRSVSGVTGPAGRARG